MITTLSQRKDLKTTLITTDMRSKVSIVTEMVLQDTKEGIVTKKGKCGEKRARKIRRHSKRKPKKKDQNGLIRRSHTIKKIVIESMKPRVVTNKKVETISTNKRQGSKTETSSSQKKTLDPKINPNNRNTSKRKNISKILRLLMKNPKETTPIKNIMKSRKTRQAIKRGTTMLQYKPKFNPKMTIRTVKQAELPLLQEMPPFTTLMLKWHCIWNSRLSLPPNSTEITTLHYLVEEKMTIS